MKKWTFLAIVTSFLMANLSFARGMQERAMRKGQMMSDLNLTKEQRAQVEELHKNGRMQMKSLFDQKHKKREELEKALSDDASEDKIRSLQKEMMALSAQIDEQRFEQMMQMRKILTPQQRKKFHQKKAKRHPGRFNKRNHP